MEKPLAREWGLIGPGADPNRPYDKSLEFKRRGRLESKTVPCLAGSANYLYFIRQLCYEISIHS
jgi:hypothetical protein